MTVKELISTLSEFDENLEINIALQTLYFTNKVEVLSIESIEAFTFGCKDEIEIVCERII